MKRRSFLFSPAALAASSSALSSTPDHCVNPRSLDHYFVRASGVLAEFHSKWTTRNRHRVTLVVGRPAMGKTAMLCGIANRESFFGPHHTSILDFSGTNSLNDRLVLSRTGLSPRLAAAGLLSLSEYHSLKEFCALKPRGCIFQHLFPIRVRLGDTSTSMSRFLLDIELWGWIGLDIEKCELGNPNPAPFVLIDDIQLASSPDCWAHLDTLLSTAHQSNLRVVVTAHIPEATFRLDIREQLASIPGIDAIVDYVDSVISLHRPEVFADDDHGGVRTIVAHTLDMRSQEIGVSEVTI